MPQDGQGNVTKLIAKAGVIVGDTWDLFALAAAQGTLITEYMDVIYLGSIVYPAAITDAPLHGTADGFVGTIDGYPVTVQFADALPRPATCADPWHTADRCTYDASRTDRYVCLWPEEPFIEVDPDGSMRMWSIQREVAEPVLLALAAIVAFARLLPHSRQTTRRGDAPPPLPSSLNAHILADITATAWWLVTYNVAVGGPATLLHVATAVVIPPDLSAVCGVAVYAAFSVNAAVVMLVSLRHTASDPLLPIFRAAYETVLLLSIVYSVPAAVAPLFHILLQFGTGATLMFVIARDTMLALDGGVFLAIVGLANTGLAAVFMLPLLVESDAMPSTTELPLLLCVLVQFAVSGATVANTRDSPKKQL